MVAQFGPPEWVYADRWVSDSPICSSCDEWRDRSGGDGILGEFSFLYPSQGLLFTSVIGRDIDSIWCLCPGMKVNYSCFSAPHTLEELLGDQQATCLYSTQEKIKKEELVRWHGFGKGH